MTDLRKAAEMALETAECITNAKWQKWEELATPEEFERWAKSRATHIAEALRQALAESANSTTNLVEPKASSQTEQEPFIYIREDTEMPFGGYEHCGKHEAGAFPVYTAPPKREWVGLTADEIWKCNKAEAGRCVEFHICSAHQNVMDFAEAIEQALKEKNGG